MSLLWQQDYLQAQDHPYQSQGKMKYQSDIIVQDGAGQLFQCLGPEKTGMKTTRSTLDIIKEKKHLRLKIAAQDAVALRASLNSVTKLLMVYEKMRNLKDA